MHLGSVQAVPFWQGAMRATKRRVAISASVGLYSWLEKISGRSTDSPGEDKSYISL